MKKWWQWFILSGIQIIICFIRYFERHKYINNGSTVISGYLFAAILFTALGILQYFFEKRGAKGKKIFDRICKVTAIILILFLIIILLKTFLF